MDYLLEQLGPDRFQALVQSLLIVDHDEVQCFPVGERDGGRDVVWKMHSGRARSYKIFQVKYVRNPQSKKDPHKWVVDTMANELPKLQEMMSDEVESYHLVTNVKGTAYLGAGSIDSLNEILGEGISVPSTVWWRDEINRRLDGANVSVKWSYPELLRGSDVLRVLLDLGLDESKDRRSSAVKAFIADQFGDDEEVRFKQVELQNDLFALFVDVPAIRTKGPGPKRERYRQAEVLARLNVEDPDEGFNFVVPSEFRNQPAGAARILLDERAQQEFPLIVIEGAPGQGKSTLAQYVCQVYRMKLRADQNYQKLPKEHQPDGIRLPIKVDLTEYAAWLAGIDPFVDAGSDSGNSRARLPKQLEAFIAALITSSSGGSEFSVSDLHAVLKGSRVLLVLDGLDEVADTKRRGQAIQEISAAARRLVEVSPSIQIVVTTRPSAFTGVGEFSSRQFHYFSLSSLTPALIKAYTGKWTIAKRLSLRDSKKVKSGLQSRLKQSHLRDLARNPMQLAILLSVIHSRGESLPDKRTALYEIYVDLFLARESEKSAVVREHRELLVDVHCYIAWMLQAQAEANSELGRIDFDKLMAMLASYLSTESRNPELAQEIFEGAQRVVFMVARVEGTFEFEVQPLREYFAAKYLYETSAYSRIGAERRGTMPDRFDALARNPYWFNVTRFFSGFLNKGELPALVDRLQALTEDEQYKYATYPYHLTATLLGDWVFSQHQRSVKAAVSLITHPAGIKALAARNASSNAESSVFALPEGAGGEELSKATFDKIAQANLSLDELLPYCRIVAANTQKDELYRRWANTYDQLNVDRRVSWIAAGLYFGVLQQAKSEQLKINEMPPDQAAQVFRWLQSANRFDIIESSRELTQIYIDDLFQGNGNPIRGSQRLGLEDLANYLSPTYYHAVFTDYMNYMSLRDAFTRIFPERHYANEKVGFSVHAPKNVGRLIKAFNSFAQRKIDDLKQEFEPWRKVVEALNSAAGLAPATIRLAIVSSFVKYVDIPGLHDFSLFDGKIDLCLRARHARLKSGNAKWWSKQFEAVSNASEAIFASSLFILSAGPATFQKLHREIDRVLSEVDESEIETVLNIAGDVGGIIFYNDQSHVRRRHVYDILGDVSPLNAALLTAIVNYPTRSKAYDLHGPSWIGRSSTLSHAIDTIYWRLSSPNVTEAQKYEDWITLLGLPRKSPGASRSLYRVHHRIDLVKSMPLPVAHRVMADEFIPASILSAAYVVGENAAFSQVEPLWSTAQRDHWFDDLK